MLCHDVLSIFWMLPLAEYFFAEPCGIVPVFQDYRIDFLASWVGRLNPEDQNYKKKHRKNIWLKDWKKTENQI